MNALHRIGAGTFLALLLAVGLAGCGEKEEVEQALDPVAFHDSDECHVCGMIISDFPGPKGQAVEKGGVKKFCSTAEMLGWWLQPENRLLDAKLYVHDMGRSVWEKPDDSHLIDATSAYYVVGTSRTVHKQLLVRRRSVTLWAPTRPPSYISASRSPR